MTQQVVPDPISMSAVSYGAPGAQAAHFQSNYTSARPFGDVVASLRSAIEAAGFRLLNEIDPQKAVQGLGRAMLGSRLLFFFHPELVVRVLEADWSAMVEAPLKFLVTELPDESVSVRIADPSAAFNRYGNSELAAFGSELARKCKQIVESSI